MSRRKVIEFLYKINSNDLQDNRLLKVLLNNWDFIKLNCKITTEIYDSIIPLYTQFDMLNPEIVTNEISENTKSELDDLRIKSIRLKSVRGVAKREDKNPFGIDFINDTNDVQSAIIVGNNGSGKTSVFSAMEFIYTGEIGEALIRNHMLNEKNRDFKYLSYLKNLISNDEPYCEIELASNKKINFQNKLCNDKSFLKNANPQSSFLSEYDIVGYGADYSIEEGNNFTNKIANLLGLSEYTKVSDYLTTIVTGKRQREYKDYQENIDNQNELQNEINNLNNELNDLQSENSPRNEDYNTNDRRIKQIKSVEDCINQNLNLIDIDTIKNYINNIKLSFNKLQINNLDIDPNFLNFLEQGLGLIQTHNDCPFCESSKKNKIKIIYDVETKINKYNSFIEINNLVNESIINSIKELRKINNDTCNFFKILDMDIEVLSNFQIADDLLNYEKIELKKYSKLIDILEEIKLKYDEYIFRNSFNYHEIESIHEKINKDLKKINITKLKQDLLDIKNHRNDLLERIKTNLLNELNDNQIIGINKVKEVEYRIRQTKETLILKSKQLTKLKEEENSLSKDKEAVDQIKKEANEILLLINKEISEIINNTIKPMEDTLVTAMKPFIEKDNLCVQVIFTKKNDSSTMFTIKLINTDTNDIINPKEYFNNFRYKMFCSTIAIGISLASRKISGINLPLVLDDEFFASDISNRAAFESYLENIILLYRKITPNMPFQFIIFTQDEMIFEAAKDAIKHCSEIIQSINKESAHDKSWNKDIYRNTIFARIFPSSDSECQPVNSTLGDQYWNLIYKFN